MNQDFITRRVIYHGRVQGVGFRVATAHIARRFPVAGFVRNLSDGTVELLAHGLADGVHGFLTQVASQFQANILRIEELAVTQEESFQGFTIQE